MADREARGGTLVVGGGFAGGYVARCLGKRGATIVSPENFMLYTPMLPEAASGTLEPRHVVVPLRVMCPHAEFVLGRATSVDFERSRVQVETIEGHVDLSYRDLVIALGADLADAADSRPRRPRARVQVARGRDPSPQPRPAQARGGRRRDRREQRLRELTFVFVGAGYAGVEALAELSDLVRDALSYYPNLQTVPQRWVLVDAAPKILPGDPSRASASTPPRSSRSAASRSASRPRSSRSRQHAAELSDGERIPTRTRVRLDGRRAAHPAALQLRPPARRARPREGGRDAARRGPRARLGARRLRARAEPRHAGRVDPPTCQHALRQARRLAKNLEGDLKPYRYRMLGQVATLGRYKGIADVLGLRLTGFLGWFITRTYHLYQLPSISRKLRVVADWTTSLFFRRDIAELSMLGHPQRLGDA